MTNYNCALIDFNRSVEPLGENGSFPALFNQFSNENTLVREELAYDEPITLKKEIVVAVIDSGVDPGNPNLQGKLWAQPSPNDNTCTRTTLYGYNYFDRSVNVEDFNGHGVHINGIIINNISSGIKLMNLKISNDQGNGDLFSAICAIRYATAKKVNVMNLSWGYYPGLSASKYPASLLSNNILKESIINALNQNIIVNAAAGNVFDSSEPVDITQNRFYPASLKTEISSPQSDKMIVVAAMQREWDTNVEGRLAWYSNYGSVADLATHGTVRSLLPNPGKDPALYRFTQIRNGTSMATAIISREAAILLGYDCLHPDDVLDELMTRGKYINTRSGPVIAVPPSKPMIYSSIKF